PMIAPTEVVKMTGIGPDTFGRMCCQMMAGAGRPIATAARMYERERAEMVDERTTRIIGTQVSTASVMLTRRTPRLDCDDRITIAPSTIGSAKMISARRESTPSVSPPKYPARIPVSAPKIADRPAATIPIVIELLAP